MFLVGYVLCSLLVSDNAATMEEFVGCLCVSKYRCPIISGTKIISITRMANLLTDFFLRSNIFLIRVSYIKVKHDCQFLKSSNYNQSEFLYGFIYKIIQYG